jgi:hypothetical protein
MKKTMLTPKEKRRATGFTDHNGIEIVEGDILAADNHHDYPFRVKFENGDFYVYSVFGKRDLLASMQSKFEKLNIKIHVSGNIDDQPDLLNSSLQ